MFQTMADTQLEETYPDDYQDMLKRNQIGKYIMGIAQSMLDEMEILMDQGSGIREAREVVIQHYIVEM